MHAIPTVQAALDVLLSKAIAYIQRLGPNFEVSAPILGEQLQIPTHHAEVRTTRDAASMTQARSRIVQRGAR